MEICKRDEEIFRQTDIIKELQDDVKATMINRAAFKVGVLKNQRLELLEKNETTQKVCERLEEELNETSEKQKRHKIIFRRKDLECCRG